jgi:hypothetical protein
MEPTRLAVVLAAVAVVVLAVLAGVAAVLFWPEPVPQPRAPAEPPAAAARDFLAAVKRKDCDTAWIYLSTDSQARIERESEREIQRAPYYAESFAPRNLYCGPTYAHRFGEYDPESVRLLSSSDGRATVGVDRHVDAGFRLPGFFPTRTEIHPTEMELVEEAGAWKVVIPDPERPRMRRPRK